MGAVPIWMTTSSSFTLISTLQPMMTLSSSVNEICFVVRNLLCHRHLVRTSPLSSVRSMRGANSPAGGLGHLAVHMRSDTMSNEVDLLHLKWLKILK